MPEGIVHEDFSKLFKWPEYIVFGAVLAASLGIGIFYGCFGSKNKSTEEFLMANRSMSILPVTLSLVCSFVSAVTLLGYPVETYYYGQIHSLYAFAFIPITLALMYWYVPVYFELQLTSAFEYFGWRFGRPLRKIGAFVGVIHLMLYIPLTVLGPSLALDKVAGFKYYSSAAAIFLLCIAYSSLGGLKAVLWTDALQAVVMFLALGSISICGLIEVGGLSEAWRISEKASRINFGIVDVDPRTRHTIWTATIGGYFSWLLLFGATQSQIQRYNSVPTLRQSRMCLLFNMFGMIIVILLTSFLGLISFAHYHDCDPVSSGSVASADQLLPVFVMDVLRNYPVIPGLFVAGITSGSLSTVSSALNSITAIIIEDFVKEWRPQWSDVKLGYASKAISTVAGLIAFGLLFTVHAINKIVNIIPFATLIHGTLLGPILGAFSLGMFVPWTNTLGVCSGMVVAVALAGYIGIGSIIEGRNGNLPDQRLELSLSGCNYGNLTAPINQDLFYLTAQNAKWKEQHADDSFVLKLFSISFVWQPVVAILSTIIIGGIFSCVVLMVNGKRVPLVHNKLLSRHWLSFWEMIFGKERMKKWVDYSEENPFRKNRTENINHAETTSEIQLSKIKSTEVTD